MVIVVCVELRRGMLFQNRRLSRDRAVCQDMLEHCPQRLWMNGYSGGLFGQLPQENICVAEDFLQRAAQGDWCFVEDQPLQPYEAAIEGLVVYQWNRRYPADRYLDLDLGRWRLEETAEFAGNSHAKITREIYRRPNK